MSPERLNEVVEQTMAPILAMWAPMTLESVCDWVEANCEIPTGEITGTVNLRNTPYAREILERFGDKTTRHLVLCFGTQLAKALALDTPIPTPSGWTTVGSLRPGDVIFGGDGKPCRVTYKTEVFQDRECYRVTFGDGVSVVADAGHLWKVRRRYDVVKTIGGKRQKATNDWREEVVTTKNLRVGMKRPHRIPNHESLATQEVDLPIGPYTLGVWLGDGKSEGAVFWNEDKDAPHLMAGIVEEGYGINRIVAEGKRTLRISISGLHSKLRNTDLLRNKHIPDVYLRASTDQRMALLRGLMDTDGTISSTGDNASFTSASEVLADGVFELAASLALMPRMKISRARVNGKDCGECYKVSFHPSGKHIFRLPRKQQRVKSRERLNFNSHEIQSVVRDETVPVQCIAVDSPDHTFLCGRSMVATHNTTILILGMLYTIARDPEDAMWVMANADQARDFNKERFMGYVRLCKAVMALVPRTPKGIPDKNLWGFVSQHYASMVLNFVGAGSPANLSSRPRGKIWMDETDKYYDQLGFDAGTIALAEERQKTFNFPMSVKASSPTLPDRMIWTEFLKTDQRQYWVPCPRCERLILLKFRVKSMKHGDCGVRWWHEDPSEAQTDGEWDMRKVKANAFYKCQECSGMIHSYEREGMIQTENGAIWKPDNPLAEAGRYGYQLSSLYSILGQETSLASIAVKFLLAKGNRSELQNFTNGWEARPFDETEIYDHREVKIEVFDPDKIARDGVPIMAIDVQAKGYWVLVRKFAGPTADHPNGQSWLLYAGFVDTLEECDEIQEDYGIDDENVTMDMAKRPNQVGRMILEHKWRGIWGSDTKKFFHPQSDGTRIERPYSVTQFRDPMLGTKWESRTTLRVRYVLFAKHAMMDMVSALRYSDPTCWHITANVHPDYVRHLNSRVKRQEKNKKTGRIEWVWYELHQDNHLLDCEVHVTVRAIQLGLAVPPPDGEGPRMR